MFAVSEGQRDIDVLKQLATVRAWYRAANRE